MSQAGTTEIGPGRFAIAGRTGERHLFTYLLLSEGEALLIDCGEAGTPEATILPAFEQIGLSPESLKWVLVTHPDVDHQGGLPRILEFAPGAVPLCGFEDRAMIRDPELMLQERYLAYTDHGLAYSDAELAEIRAGYGSQVPIAATLVGGERMAVGEIEFTIRHSPGHSAGHLMVHDPAEGSLFISDAIHGRFSPAVGGEPALPVTYEDVDSYLNTIATVRALDPKAIYSGHFEPLRGPDVAVFLDSSQAFVDELEGFVLSAIAARPVSLEQLCGAASERFGPYLVPDDLFRFALHGHVRRLARDGRARIDLAGEVPLFSSENDPGPDGESG